MVKLKVFWSHICVLAKGEDDMLASWGETLAEKGIELEVTHFGLGRGGRMADHIRQTHDIPDIIVSSDLEVFEDRRIWSEVGPHLADAGNLYPLKPSAGPFMRSLKTIPYLAIPLAFHSNTISCGVSVERIAREGQPIAFGGIDNSAARTVVKTVWSRWGKEAAESLFKKAVVTPMPIGAYSLSKSGAVPLSVSPLLFPISGGLGNVFAAEEGVLAVPTYCALSEKADKGAAAEFFRSLASDATTGFYSSRGRLFCLAEGSPDEPWMEGKDFLLPDWDWLRSYDPAEFDTFYRTMIPSAK